VVGALATTAEVVVACALLEEWLEPQALTPITSAEVAHAITKPRSSIALMDVSFPAVMRRRVTLLAYIDNRGLGFLPTSAQPAGAVEARGPGKGEVATGSNGLR
jgi:hypothetical protein